MFKLGMKGSIGTIIGSIAIMLILFGINTANNVSEQNQTLLNLQVAKETALGTENLIRMLDKTTAKVIYANMINSACNPTGIPNRFQVEYEEVIQDFINATSSPIGCTVTADWDGDPIITVIGTLNCSIELGDFRAADERSFRFEKEIITTDIGPGLPECSVKDTASGCQEQPYFDC